MSADGQREGGGGGGWGGGRKLITGESRPGEEKKFLEEVRIFCVCRSTHFNN